MSTPFYDLASLVLVPSGYKASKVYAQKPLTTDGQLAFSRSTTATRVNSAGLIESVAINVPRLDYLGSTCPKLLLEPQRTNLNLYSEQFNNADWEKTYSTITANATTSPDGYTNADAWFETSDNNWHRLYDNGISVTSGTAYTCSLFVKPNGRNWVSMEFFAGGGGFNGSRVWFNIANGTIGTTQTGITAKIENYGNGWYRISATQTAAASTTGYILYLLATGDGVVTYAGDPTKGAFVYGGMTEAGAYATSYIPTLGAAVTRGADTCSKTGISSLIGQAEGTFYCEVDMRNLDKAPQQLLELYQDANNRIGIAAFWDSFSSVNRMQLYQFFGGGLEVNIQETITSGVLKVAAAYKANDYVLYINGVQIGTDTSASVPATSTIYLGSNGSNFFVGNGVKQALLFKTRLTNAQLAELTTL